jgi:hypothetical protein
MKRKSMVSLIALLLMGLSLPFLGCSSAQAQKRGRSSTSKCKEAVISDWRYPEVVKEGDGLIDLGDSFKAFHLDCDTVTVAIPGAYSDTLTGGGWNGPRLGVQLAAAAFVRVNAAPTKDAAEALKSYYLGSQDVRQGNGEVQKEYAFRLSNGRTSRISVYFNDQYGLLGIVKTDQTSKKK